MSYNITIYDGLRDGTSRFILGTSGKKTLIAIGLNPSHANRIKPDTTVSKIIGFSEKASQNFDSFIMLNLYPQRATNPQDVHIEVDKKIYAENLKTILHILTTNKNAYVLAAWGDTISTRKFFTQCLKDLHQGLKEHKINWLQIGELTKNNNPRHPSRVSYESPLKKFNFNDYIKNLDN